MKNLLSIILLIAAGAVGYLYGYQGWLDVQDLKRERAAHEAALDDVRDFKAKRKKLTESLDEIPSRDQARLRRMLPEETDALHLLMSVHEFLRDLGYQPSGLSLGGAAVEGRAQPGENASANASGGNGSASGQSGSLSGLNLAYESTSISFSVSGSYERLRFLLEELQRQRRIFDVTGLSFSVNEGGQNSYSIMMHTYSLANS